MGHHAEATTGWVPDRTEWILRGVVALVALFLLAYMWHFFMRYTHNQDRQAADIRSSVLASYGDTKATESAYDLAVQCLESPGLTEEAATLVARCQSLSLSYIDRSAFPEADKQAAHGVITDLSTRYVRQAAQ